MSSMFLYLKSKLCILVQCKLSLAVRFWNITSHNVSRALLIFSFTIIFNLCLKYLGQCQPLNANYTNVLCAYYSLGGSQRDSWQLFLQKWRLWNECLYQHLCDGCHFYPNNKVFCLMSSVWWIANDFDYSNWD